MKLIPNKYSIRVINPKPMCTPVPEPVPVPVPVEEEPRKRSAALVKAQQKYYEKNKAKITLKQTQYNKMYSKLTHLCPCGDTVSNSAKYSHIKSKRHNRRMENIKNGVPAGTTHGEKFINCECGGFYKYKQRHQHFRTKKHHKFEAEKQDELKKQLEQNTYDTMRNQLRKMLFAEGIEEEDTSQNINSNEIKVI